MPRDDGARVIRLLRVPADGELLDDLAVLFAFSLQRAYEALERTGRPGLRRAITHGVIGPLQEGAGHVDAARRRRSPRAVALPAGTVRLAHRQLLALETARWRADFRHDVLPPPLRVPGQLVTTLRQALGEVAPPDATAAGPSP